MHVHISSVLPTRPGGEDSSTIFSDLWTVRLSRPFYLSPAREYRPAERKKHAMFTRVGGGSNDTGVYVFGGQSQTGLRNDLWHWSTASGVDGGSWRLISGSSSSSNVLLPPGMAGMMAEYDSSRDVLWVWGGVYEAAAFRQNATAASANSDPSTAVWQYSWYELNHMFLCVGMFRILLESFDVHLRFRTGPLPRGRYSI